MSGVLLVVHMAKGFNLPKGLTQPHQNGMTQIQQNWLTQQQLLPTLHLETKTEKKPNLKFMTIY